MIILQLLILIIAAEAITEIITSSEITVPLRRQIKMWAYPLDEPPVDTFWQKFKVWLDKLISCGYCSSVWVSFFLAWFAQPIFDNKIINVFVHTFMIHRMSNYYHVIYEIVRKGRVKTYDLLLKINEDEVNGISGESINQERQEDIE